MYLYEKYKYMGNFICKICESNFETQYELTRHFMYKHEYKPKDAYIVCVLDGKTPLCECGCGGEPRFISARVGYYKFMFGHHNRVKGKNNFHKNPETHQKAIDTQKKNWKAGKYTGWWEHKDEATLQKIEGIKEKLRNDKERGRKISKAMKGRPKTEESKIKLSITQKKRYNDNPELKRVMSERRIQFHKNKQNKKKSKLEIKFQSILDILNINYINQYEFNKRLFDFYLIDFNILIEVDGDFYHCNPNSNHSEITYPSQRLTKNNDDYKNRLCEDNNIKLIRYWEKDINDRPEWVISDLKEQLINS